MIKNIMKTVIKNSNNGKWVNQTQILTEADWHTLIWLTPEQIAQLRRGGTLLVEEFYYYVTTDNETIEIETNKNEYVVNDKLKNPNYLAHT
jgi:hypothetical protein